MREIFDLRKHDYYINGKRDFHYPVDKCDGGCNTSIEKYKGVLAIAWADVTGKDLDGSKVAKARKEEVGYIHKTNLYTKVPRSKAAQLGAKVVTVRWIDINKGDIKDPQLQIQIGSERYQHE